MSSKVILKAEDLDGYLTEKDQEFLSRLDSLYEEAMKSFKVISSVGFSSTIANEEKKIISLYNEMGQVMQEVCKEVPSLKVFSL
jgi:uracil phosphoribosyltransferase